MIFLKSFSGNRYFLFGCILAVFLPGCAVAPVTTPGGQEDPFPLKIQSVSPDKFPPQAAGASTVRFKAEATGGVGEREYIFWSSDGKAETAEQKGLSPMWDWSPRDPGVYRLRVVVRDAIGNTADSGWSPEYRIELSAGVKSLPRGQENPFPLKIQSVSPDKFPPQAAGASTVRFKAEATGGVGEREYIFWSSDGKAETAEQKGLSPMWDWSPRDPGVYRLRVVVRDAIGNTADSGWSPEYRIELATGLNSLIAVMPVENLTGMPIPVSEVRKSIIGALKRKNFNLLPEDVLEGFLERHRIRYTGGINRELAKTFREETGTNAVLFVSLELFDEAVFPKTALGGRLVSTHSNASILWMDSVGMAGNDAPGFLLLGLVDDPRVLWERARDRLVKSLTRYLSGGMPEDARKIEKKFLPKSFIGHPPKPPVGKEAYSVAVLPFRNESTRRYAGEILALHFIRELSKAGKLKVVEPGEVRQALLKSRTIMEGGLSLPQADILHDVLDVDLVLDGVVTEYQDANSGWTKPKVDFFTRVFDRQTRQIVWSSYSYNLGDDGVFFFNLGTVNTAHGLASGMVRSVIERMDTVMDGGKEQIGGAVPPVSK